MQKKKTIIIVVGVAVAAFAVYWFLFRKKSATSPADQAAYDRLYNLFSANIDKSALNGWMADGAAEIYNGAVPMDPKRLINGQITKTGALLSAYATGYYGRGYKNTMPEGQLNEQAYAIFFDLRNQLGTRL